jgi:hypothetical protein
MKAELLRDGLSKGDRRSIEARVAALQKQVDHAVAKAADPPAGAQGNGKVDDGKVEGNGRATGHGGEKGKATGRGGKKATVGKPNATRTTESGAGGQDGATSHDKKADRTAEPTSDPTSDSSSERVEPSHAAGSGSRPRQSSADDPEDAPASATATADPSTPSGGAGGSGSHKATGGGRAGDTGAGKSKADPTNGASTAR